MRSLILMTTTPEVFVNTFRGAHTMKPIFRSIGHYAGLRSIALSVIALGSVWGSTALHAQASFERWPITNEAWLQPFPPVRIIGNLYHVGTYEFGFISDNHFGRPYSCQYGCL